MKKYKIIIGFLMCLLIFGSTFAYDLTDKEKSKGDKVAQKVLLLISKKSEDKQEIFKEKILVQLKRIYVKTTKNEKIHTLVGYVIEKVQGEKDIESKIVQEDMEKLNPRYPGCDKDDIIVGAYTIAACNVGTQKSGTGKESYGTLFTFSESQKKCASGYHIPSNEEWTDINNAGNWGDNGDSMSKALMLPLAGYRSRTQGQPIVSQGDYGAYWTSSIDNENFYHMIFSPTYFEPANSNIILNTEDYNLSGKSVRCMKD